MARTTKPLTNTEVKQAKPKDKIYTLSDGGGLQLRVKLNGSKLWLFDYLRPYTKKRTCLSFGAYPALSLAAARKERDKAKVLLAKDIDPKEYRDETNRQKEQEHANTLKHVATQWLEVKKTTVSVNHANDSWRSLELHIFPSLGKLPIQKITAVKTIDTIKPIAAKGNLETVKRLCQRLNEIMVYAVNTGILPANPLAGISKAFQTPVKQHLPSLKPEQLPDLMGKINKASIKRTTRFLIEWQLHTMVRPSEAAGTRWEEIDFETQLWTIPAERMKKRKEHIVPLTDQCIAFLESIKLISGHRQHVFPADRNPRTHANSSTVNVALKRMGYSGKLVSHGLRSLASTTLNEQGFDADVIEAALAHTGKDDVRNAYNRADYLERRKLVMQWWSEHIDKASRGSIGFNGKKTLALVNNESM